MALLTPSYLDCVVAIGSEDQFGKVHYCGSGFLYGRHEDRGYRNFLVTNRHVLNGMSRAVIRVNGPASTTAQEFTVPLMDDNGATWAAHKEENIDVAAVPLSANIWRKAGISTISLFRDDQDVLFKNDPATNQLYEGDGIFLLGFPLGLVEGPRNYVIVRAGCLARVRDFVAGNADTFLIDVANFPGNSGGPVINKPDVAAVSGTTPVGSSKLMGMVQSYIPYEDIAVSTQTGAPRVIFQENSGLASVIPAERVQEAVETAVELGLSPLSV